ncbi:hypothetical protein ACOME3_009744 [Neoechinorhynchus agilis]
MAIQMAIRTMMNKGRSSEERFWLASETNCTTACTDPIVCPVFTFLIMACDRFGFVGFINRFIVKTFNLIRSESSFDPLTADKHINSEFMKKYDILDNPKSEELCVLMNDPVGSLFLQAILSIDGVMGRDGMISSLAKKILGTKSMLFASKESVIVAVELAILRQWNTAASTTVAMAY